MNDKIQIAILIIAMVFSGAVEADWYAEVAIGVYAYDAGLPEIDLQSPLLKGVVGAENEDGVFVELEHISSQPQREKGNGINAAWMGYRARF